MDKQMRKLNRYLMIGWMTIVVVLTATYLGELIRGHRDWGYMAAFLSVTIIPAAACLIYYFRDKGSTRLRYYAVTGYLLMYVFVLLNTNTVMTYGYIIPMLSLIVLYHSPKLVLSMGAVALAANIACVARFFIIGMVTSDDIKDVEIQLGMILFCFSFAYIASRIYQKIVLQNNEYIESINNKQTQLERVTLQTITTIANIIDAKDEYTKGHSYRVAEYSSILAKELGYDKQGVANVKYIGLLHDIGKIGIPDSILNKPGKLTDSEYAIMRKHAEIGGNILNGNNMIANMGDGAMYHHERYDGRGYPMGLKGEEIPEMARIIGIADAYDAMTSNRIYRKRLSDETVMTEIRRCSGTQFDPKIADVFVKLIEDGKLAHISPESDPGLLAEGMAERSASLLQDVIKFKSDPYDSEHDYLTGVLSKSAGERAISDALAEGDGGLFIADITSLQETNAKHGIVTGDMIIKTVADGLKAREELMAVRYNGSGFLCFAKGVTERRRLEEMMSEICSDIKEQMRSVPDFESSDLCIGGALSTETGRSFSALLSAADKALFYIKQLKQNGVYLYRKNEKNPDERLYGFDLEQLINMIKKNEPQDDIVAEIDPPEFAKIYDTVKEIYKKNEDEMYLVLLSVSMLPEKSPTVADRDVAMEYLRNAIDITIGSSCIAFRFSSCQFMAIFTNVPKDDVYEATGRVFNSFYKSYDKNNMTLKCETAHLAQSG